MVDRNTKFRSIQTTNNLSHQESPKSNYENLNPNFLALKKSSKSFEVKCKSDVPKDTTFLIKKKKVHHNIA